MIIYFIRHGETQSNKEHRITGHVDSLLTEDGIAQAEKAALEIASDFSEIYSSDLIRCKDTSAILNKKLNIPITYDSRLRERSFGSLEGKTWNDIEGSDVLKKLDKTQSYDYRPYGGESVDDVKERVLSFIDDIRNTKRDKKILVVSSGGVIRLLHNILHGEAPGVFIIAQYTNSNLKIKMKIKFKKEYILVISKSLVYFFGFLGGVGNKAKGSAFFPFIFVKSEEFIQPWLINHERIHFRQQLETLFIGSILLMIFERLYARIVLQKTKFDAYIWSSGEQEAYLNQHNLDYLKTRPLWNQFRYLKNKKKISLPSPGEVIIR